MKNTQIKKLFIGLLLLIGIPLVFGLSNFNSIKNVLAAGPDENGLIYTLSGDSNSYSVTDCNESDTTITIPSTYAGKPVTSIGTNAFISFELLESIIIPSSVTSIEGYAFSGCSGLNSLTLSEGLISIGNYCFYNCGQLLSVSIPSTVTAIGDNAFYNCLHLAEINISSPTLSLGNMAFASCIRLTTISLTSTTPPTITANTFSNSISNLTETTIIVPKSSAATYIAASNWSSLSEQIYANYYVVNFYDSNGTTLLKAENVNYGEDATAPANPLKTGYTFTGWNNEYSGVTSDLTITATYLVNQYTVAFYTYGGSNVEPITQNYGTTITAPEAPTKEGYIFSGWFSDSSLTTPYIFTTISNENVILYASWEKAPFDFTWIYILCGGCVLLIATVIIVVAIIKNKKGKSTKKPAVKRIRKQKATTKIVSK